ncbi:MAG: hypothetical protein EXR99_04320 [Gemmataceae bacterium]|nr:hypothetical protein [Gemmataceae bacterium]
MLRRRRPKKGIHFSFDSFLDVVANVVGIIIRLILVAWVGAKSYKGIELPANLSQPPALLGVEESMQPLAQRVGEKEMAAVKWGEISAGLKIKGQREKLRETDSAFTQMERDLQHLVKEEKSLKMELRNKQELENFQKQNLGKGLEKLTKLEAEYLALKKSRGPVQELRYQTPVSKTLQSEELLFECRHGRVTAIDIGSMLEEIGGQMQGLGERLRTQWEVEDTSQPHGAFRMRFTVERIKTALELSAPNAPPDSRGNFRFALTGWEMQGLDPERGETLEQALQPQAEFMRILNGLDHNNTAITFCVYPDSFPLYRRLRDLTHEKKFVVAGRPLMVEAPIAMSVKKGTASRGQ